MKTGKIIILLQIILIILSILSVKTNAQGSKEETKDNIQILSENSGLIQLKQEDGNKNKIKIIFKYFKDIPEGSRSNSEKLKTKILYEVFSESGEKIYEDVNDHGGLYDEITVGGKYKIILENGAEMLAILYSIVPSAPGGGWGYQIYGFDKNNKFRNFGHIGDYGHFRNKILGNKGEDFIDGYIELAKDKYLEIEKIAYYFSVIRRFEIDSVNCLIKEKKEEMFNVTYERDYDHWKTFKSKKEATINLYKEPKTGAEVMKIKITKETKVKVLGAVQEGKGYWLLLQIDNIKGWVSNQIGQEDLMKLGFSAFG